MSTKSAAVAGASAKTTTTTTTANRITPPHHNHNNSSTTATTSSSLDRHLRVDRQVVDELLLVCGVIGSHDDVSGSFVPVTDCHLWLGDLQRALRRDDDVFRPISLLLGDWRVVSTKLLPLLCCAGSGSTSTTAIDGPVALTVCKILVVLTKPLAAATRRAAVVTVDTRSAKAKKPGYQSLRAQQIRLRDNALQQARQLMEYKRTLCQAQGFFRVLVALLAEPLAKTRRTEEEHLTVEIVLHLIRNLLQAQPLMTATDDDDDDDVHHRLVRVLEEELVLDVLCVLCADLEQPGSPNAAYNLLLMEILQHLVLPYPVEHVVAAAEAEADQPTNDDNNKTNDPTTSKPSKDLNRAKSTRRTGTGALRGTLLRERQAAQAMASARHGNFGGSLVLGEGDNGDDDDDDKNRKNNNNTTTKTDGKAKTKQTWTVSTTQYAATALGRTAVGPAAGTTRGNNRSVAVFVGARRRHDGAATTPAARAARTALARFGHRFLRDCFAPWTKSLKNEFRRDSVRLEDGDRVVWLQLVAYWSRYWRATKPTRKHSSIGPLLFTMDVFSFHLVHNATDTFTQHKEYGKLAHAVSLLKEMMLLLQMLYDSQDETEQIMAMGLLDRLFYGSEPLDRLPKLLSQWQPGQASHQYAADLAELVHTQIKMLERHARACADLVDDDTGKRKKSKKTKKDTVHTDTITDMKVAAADFDVMGYVRKLATPHNVYLYTQLLAQYAVNGTRLNHRVVTFLLRVSQFQIAAPERSRPEDDDDDDVPRNLIANTRVVTLEPMLYNVRLLWVLHSILNDVAAVRDKSLDTVVQFAVRIVNRFAAAAADNPMLAIEALVKHAAPHRYCEALTNHYVTEELVMMAERDTLLEEQEKWRAEEEYRENDDVDVDDDDDERLDAPRPVHNRRPRIADDSDDEGEVEFDGGAVEAVTTPEKSKTKVKSRKKKRKAILEDSDSEDEKDDDSEDSEQGQMAEKEREHPPEERHETDGDSEKDGQQNASNNSKVSSSGNNRKQSAFADDSDSDDDSMPNDNGPTETIPPPDKKRKAVMDDSDDDGDDDGDMIVSTADDGTDESQNLKETGSPSKKARTALSEDEDAVGNANADSDSKTNTDANPGAEDFEGSEGSAQRDDPDENMSPELTDGPSTEPIYEADDNENMQNTCPDTTEDDDIDAGADAGT